MITDKKTKNSLNEKFKVELEKVKDKILFNMISYSSIKNVDVKGPFGLNEEPKKYINIKITVKTLVDIDMEGIKEMIFETATNDVDITMLIPDIVVKSNNSKKGYSNYKNKDSIIFYLEYRD